MLDFHPHFDIRHNQDSRVVSCTRRPRFTPKEIPRYPFLLEAEWTPGLLKADVKIRSFRSFQEPRRESNTGRLLWRSASTNCATVRPPYCTR